jgi:hypothetical protein
MDFGYISHWTLLLLIEVIKAAEDKFDAFVVVVAG